MSGFGLIPAEWQSLDRWVVWRWEPDPAKPEKPRKPPYPADAPGGHRHASNDKPDDWTTFMEAVAVVEAGKADGIGFALMPPYVGVDLDEELSGDEQWSIMRALDSYAEVSPSGKGYHVILRASLNGKGRHPTGIGVFQVGRFWYCTGQHVPESPATIEERQAELEAVVERYLPKPVATSVATPRQPVDLDDRELLERAFAARNGQKFRRLWEGDVSGYSSHSQADQALLNMLAFWTGRDAARMDALFRSSGLVRDKWLERVDYVEVTIGKAIAATTDVYTPARSEPSPRSDAVGAAVPASESPSTLEGASGWPSPLSEDAYHGVAGAVVRTIDPETQADPAAVLVQFLTAVGAACGRGSGFTVDGARHGVNLFTQIVGDSATSRKGSSFAQAIAPVLCADATFSYTTGLSSGEGLIWEVRDPIESRRKAKSTEDRARADDDGFITEVVDTGIDDKRLLVAETEFASVFARMGREGNTLSAVIRQAWEGAILKTMTKQTPATATGAHIAIVAHITAEELRAKLSEVDMLSGFSNRFLWTCAKRSKSLPRGGKQIEWRGSAEVEQIRDALRLAQVTGDVDFDDDAGELWDGEYERLETSRSGLLAAVTNRAAAQTRRLATLYAILDCKDEIKFEHLQAALALWAYCEDSCRYLFGQLTGDPTADTLLDELRKRGDRGMTRTDIRDAFARNVPAKEIDAALGALLLQKKVRREEKETGGRPETRWWTL